MAVGTFFVSPAFILFHHGGRYDTCGYGNNRVTDQHDTGGKEFSAAGGGSNISITYGSHGDDSPIDAVRDIVKQQLRVESTSCILWLCDGSHQNDDKQEEHCNLLTTFTQGSEQPFPLIQKVEKLEDAEHTYQAEGTNDE